MPCWVSLLQVMMIKDLIKSCKNLENKKGRHKTSHTWHKRLISQLPGSVITVLAVTSYLHPIKVEGLAQPGNVLTSKVVWKSPLRLIPNIWNILYLSCEAIRCRQQEQWLWQQGFRSQLPTRCSCKHNPRTPELSLCNKISERHQMSLKAKVFHVLVLHGRYPLLSFYDWLDEWLPELASPYFVPFVHQSFPLLFSHWLF